MAVTALVMVLAAAYILSQPSQVDEVAPADMPVPVSGEDRFGT
jgi:hypothetical protein